MLIWQSWFCQVDLYDKLDQLEILYKNMVTITLMLPCILKNNQDLQILVIRIVNIGLLNIWKIVLSKEMFWVNELYSLLLLKEDSMAD